jgi:hypothetical protein
MGVYLTQRETNFHIKKEDFEPALKALQQAAKERVKESGHWSWIDMDTIIKAKTLVEAMEELRWTPEIEKHEKEALEPKRLGDIINLGYNGEKWGDEETFFGVLASFVESGSYIEVEAEGDIFRWVFKNGQIETVGGNLTFEDLEGMIETLLEQKKLLPMLMGIHPLLDEKIANAMRGDD